MSTVRELALRSRKAAIELGQTSDVIRVAALRNMAIALRAAATEILAANARDIERCTSADAPSYVIDRLLLDSGRIEAMAVGIEDVAGLPDPLGRELERFTHPKGFSITKVSVPLGVIGIIYEGRPNVTSDSAALCLKSGNTAVLRGSSTARLSNEMIVAALQNACAHSNLNPNCIQLVTDSDRSVVREMFELRGLLDVLIPRGGAELIQFVTQNSSVPVLETGAGNCHIYLHDDADEEKAFAITINAKCQRPSVCNSAETVLVHRDAAKRLIPPLVSALTELGVECRGCSRSVTLSKQLIPATEADWQTEYLDLVLAVKIVDSLDDALVHIQRYGTNHSECIVTENEEAAQAFLLRVDAAAVYHNVSTRFTDGFEFGFGAEIGISTQKLHARGPMGLRELTSYKYLVRGDGQIR